MTTTIASLAIEISSDVSKALSGIAKVDKGLDNLVSQGGRSIRNFGSSVTGLGTQFSMLTAPIGAAMYVGISLASDFQNSLAELSARTGITGDALNTVRDAALGFGEASSFSSQQALDGMLQLAASGWSVQDAIKGLPGIMDAAAAGGVELGFASDAITNAMSAFGLVNPADAGLVADALVKAAGASSADFTGLTEGISNVGGVASQYGLDITETAAALAVFADNGIAGAEAGTQLKSMLLNWNSETAQKAFEKLGVSLYDNEGNVRDFDTVLDELGGSLDKLPVNEQNTLMTELAGSYGLVGLSALLSSGGIDTMMGKMDGSAGAAEVAAARMNTFSGKMDTLKGTVETLAIKTLTPFMEDVLTPMAEKITELVGSVIEWTDANPELTNQIVGIAAAALTIGPALVLAGVGLQAAGVAITALGTVATVAGSIMGAISLPMIALVGAVGLLIAVVNDPAIQTGLKSWEGVFDMLPQVMQAVSLKIDQTFNDAAVSIRSFVRDIKSELADAVAQIALAGQALGLGIGDETVANMTQELATIDIAKRLEAALNASMTAGGGIQFDMAQISWITSDAAPAGLFDKLVSNIADPRLIQDALGSAISMGNMQAVEVLAPLALKFADDPALQMQELLTQALTLGGPEGQAAFQALVPLAAELGIDTQELIMQMGAGITTAATEGTYSAAVDVGITLNPIFSNMGAFNSTIQSAAQSAGASAMGPALPPGIPAFADGGKTGSWGGLALLHPYEQVLNPAETRAYNDGGRGNTNTINISGVQDVDGLLSELARRGIYLT